MFCEDLCCLPFTKNSRLPGKSGWKEKYETRLFALFFGSMPNGTFNMGRFPFNQNVSLNFIRLLWVVITPSVERRKRLEAIGWISGYQNVWFEYFRQRPVANGTAFSKISKKEDKRDTQILDNFLLNFSSHSTFLPQFLELLVEWFAFRKFNADWREKKVFFFFSAIPFF